MFSENLLDAFPVTFFLGIACLLSLYWFSTKNFDYWKKKGIPQAGQPLPFVGTLYPLLWKTAHDLDLERYLKFGPVYGQFDGGRPTLVVSDPKMIREILVKEAAAFDDRPIAELVSGNALTKSFLFFVYGEDWRRTRSFISPAFSTGRLKRMINHIKHCCRSLTENLKKASKNGKPLVLKDFTNAFVMNVIASCAFSVELDSFSDPNNIFVRKALESFSSYVNLKIVFHQLMPRLSKMIGTKIICYEPMYFFKETALSIMRDRKKSGYTRHDFLQYLMGTLKEFTEEKEEEEGNEEKNSKSHEERNDQTKESLTVDETISQIVQFFLGGFDTVSMTISHAAYQLALNPDVQNKAYEEVCNVLQKTGGDLTYEALQEMTYLENIVAETLRLYPVFPRLGRISLEEYKLGDKGVVLPRNSSFVIPIYAIHKDPTIYPDPEKFDPDRFLPEERAKRDPYTYLPFGAGPRFCIGQRFAQLQMRICLAYFLANFKIHRCPETKVPLEFRLGPGPLVSKPPIVRFEERTDTSILK